MGHTVQGDIRFLEKTINIEAKEVKGFVDLAKIFKEKFPNELQYSLAFMCEKLLFKKLSKYEQRSNWNRRPLKKTQLHYAALDAAVCLEIYEALIDQKVDVNSMTQKQGTFHKVNELVRTDNLVYSR